MKQLMMLLMMMFVFPVFAGYEDGILSEGETEKEITINESNKLLIDGGGVFFLDVEDFGQVEVKNTTPLDPGDLFRSSTKTNDSYIPIVINPNEDYDEVYYEPSYTHGIYTLCFYDNSHLLYSGGVTGRIWMSDNATAVLKGGSIDMLFSSQDHSNKTIDIYCREGWEWIEEEVTCFIVDENDNLKLVDMGIQITGIKGQWYNGDSFSISLERPRFYRGTWENVNVITPEPTSLILLSIGVSLIRRK